MLTDGRGSGMGGQAMGLPVFRGRPLIGHGIVVAAQIDEPLIIASRNTDLRRAMATG